VGNVGNVPDGLHVRLHARETCSTEGKKVSKRESNLWITFLLSKSYVGNVGNVGYGLKSLRLPCMRAYS
jgi:hypothetical protein